MISILVPFMYAHELQSSNSVYIYIYIKLFYLQFALYILNSFNSYKSPIKYILLTLRFSHEELEP